MASPIHTAAGGYQATRARLLAEANQAAEQIRLDLGLPRDRRQWADHPALWNNLNTAVVTQLNQARQRALDELAAAKGQTRRDLYRAPASYDPGINRVLAEQSYRSAREYALALPLGEVGFSMAMERMTLAELVGDEPMMAALSLLAEQRGGQGGTVWDRIPQRWAAATQSKYVQERLADLEAVDQAMRQLADPERFHLGKLTPLAPEPEPPPTLQPVPTLNGGGGEPSAA